MKKYFLDLFEFNNWANEKIILRLHNVSKNFKDTNPLAIMGHIISAQETWLERVKGTKSYNIFLWDDYSIQEIDVLSLNSYNEWKKFINKMNEKKFEQECIYKNSRGKRNSRTYQDILQHVINHSTYHRGQINLVLSQNDIKPENIDFIDYC